MNKKFLLTGIVLGLLLISFASAAWYNPLSWGIFSSSEVEIESPYLILQNEEWKVMKQTGNEVNFDVHFADLKDKKTEICFTLKDGVNPLNVDLTDKQISYIDGTPILDDKAKVITIKYESSKCNVSGVMTDGYHLSLTEAAAININNEIKLGENSIDIKYQNYSRVNYAKNGINISATLRNEREYLQGAAIDGSDFNFGNITQENHTYSFGSIAEIIEYRNNYYFKHGNQLYLPDTKKVCSQINASCQYSIRTEKEINYIDMTFYAGENKSDPSFTITDLSTGINIDTSTDNGYNWLNFNSDNVLLYMNFDTDEINTILRDFSQYTNDGTVTQAGGSFDAGLVEGVIGNAYYFSQIVSIEDMTFSNALCYIYDECTVSYWFNASTGGAGDAIMAEDNDGSNKQWRHNINSTGAFSIVDYAGVSSFSHKVTDIDLNLNEWNYVTVSRNSTTWMVYLNGVVATLDNNEVKGPGQGTPTLQVGGARLGSQARRVTIDDVLIMNKTVSSSEASDLYRNRYSKFLSSGNVTFNQSISSGNNTINVSSSIQSYNGSKVGLKIYDGTSWTDEQNITHLDNYTFSYSDSATILNLTYTLYPNNYNGYTSILFGDISMITFTSVTGDSTYPQFTNLQDNNATLIDTGIGVFNVTIENTNGTVFLNINGTSILATNETYGGAIYNATHTFIAAGLYPYNWTSWGNGTDENFNISETLIYLVNTSVVDTCTYTSGNWEVDCADNCTINTNVDVGGNNISVIGSGFFNVKANITNWVSRFFSGVDINNKCTITSSDGGGFN